MNAAPMVQGGTTANHNGNILESQIETLLHSKGYQQGQLTGRGFIRQYRRFENLYGVPWKLDFFVKHPDRYPSGLAIETKWQSVGGSADEKLFFAVRSLEALPFSSVLIIGGEGARACAIRWCKNQAVFNPRLTVLHGLDNTLQWAQGAL